MRDILSFHAKMSFPEKTSPILYLAFGWIRPSLWMGQYSPSVFFLLFLPARGSPRAFRPLEFGISPSSSFPRVPRRANEASVLALFPLRRTALLGSGGCFPSMTARLGPPSPRSSLAQRPSPFSRSHAWSGASSRSWAILHFKSVCDHLSPLKKFS